MSTSPAGLMWESAPDFGAMLVFAEHRWGWGWAAAAGGLTAVAVSARGFRSSAVQDAGCHLLESGGSGTGSQPTL